MLDWAADKLVRDHISRCSIRIRAVLISRGRPVVPRFAWADGINAKSMPIDNVEFAP